MTKSRRLYPGYHLSTPEKPDLYSVPSTVPDTDSSSAVRFNTCVPGANLPAEVKMKGDTVQVQIEYSTYCGNTGLFPEWTKEIADQERSFQNNPECKHQSYNTFVCQSLTVWCTIAIQGFKGPLHPNLTLKNEFYKAKHVFLNSKTQLLLVIIYNVFCEYIS